MKLHHILAAADESEAGRQAVRSAIDLAARAHARVTVMRAVPVGAMAVAAGATGAYDFAGAEMESPRSRTCMQWIGSDLHAQPEPPPVELGIASGVPESRSAGWRSGAKPTCWCSDGSSVRSWPGCSWATPLTPWPGGAASRASSCRPTAARSAGCWWRLTASERGMVVLLRPAGSPRAPGRSPGGDGGGRSGR